MNTNVLLAGITKQLKWADGGKVGEYRRARGSASSSQHVMGITKQPAIARARGRAAALWGTALP